MKSKKISLSARNDKRGNQKKSTNIISMESHRLRDLFRNILLFLFIFLLPSQLGKHLFFSFSYIFGIRVDYLAPTIYLTDVLVSFLLILYRKHVITLFQNRRVLILLIVLALNVLFSTLIPISFYRYLKIIELLALFAIFRKKKINSTIILWGMFAGTVLQTVLVAIQFITKQSVQGFFYFFGERLFTISTPGVAKAALDGIELLRPYGTFSHPNSMGGFYLLVYTFFLFSKIKFNPAIIKNVTLILCSFLVFFSLSKGALTTFILINFIYIFLNIRKSTCSFCMLSRVFGLFVLALFFSTATTDLHSIDKRVELMNWAVSLVNLNPWLGIGLGAFTAAAQQFTSTYPYTSAQPVHNIFLLLLTELGIIVSGILGYILCNFAGRNRDSTAFLVCALVIVITGMADHYWITLQQNWLLMGAVLGIVTNRRYLS